jgi:hypothetical protein
MYTSAHACNEAGAIPFGLISTNSPPCPPNFDDFQAAARRMNQQVVLPNLDVFDGFDLRRKRPAPHDLNAYSSASSDDLSAYFSAYYHESETMWGESGKRPTSFTETLISAWVQLLEMMLVLHRRLCRMKSSECWISSSIKICREVRPNWGDRWNRQSKSRAYHGPSQFHKSSMRTCIIDLGASKQQIAEFTVADDKWSSEIAKAPTEQASPQPGTSKSQTQSAVTELWGKGAFFLVAFVERLLLSEFSHTSYRGTW